MGQACPSAQDTTVVLIQSKGYTQAEQRPYRKCLPCVSLESHSKSYIYKVIVNPSYKGLSPPRAIVNPMLVLTMSVNPCLQGLQGQKLTPVYKVKANTNLQGHNLHLFRRSN